MSPPDFVNAIYAAGAKGSFDALAHHPYSWPSLPGSSDPASAWGQLFTIRNLMVKYGDAGKQVWLTEYGAPTGGPGHVSEATSSAMLTGAVRLAGNLPWAGPLFWYTYQDPGTNQGTVEDFFGLIRHNGTHKPAYAAFKAATGAR